MCVIIDCRTSIEEINNLKKLGFKPLMCPKSDLLYEAVSGHPDMLLKIVNNNTILVHKDMPLSFINKLRNLGYKIFLSKNNLNSKYPNDIILNSVNLDDIFIHNIKYTDPVLLNFMKRKRKINVNQGYTKCSTAIVSNKAIITSDLSIANAVKIENIDTLLVPPGDILLPGLDYGFIGGCCGLIDSHTMAFYGNLKYYKYGKEVLEFLNKYSVNPVFLRNDRLIDRGSILKL
ncbi:hypothetical protein D4Z93_04275 [Clostridium fermenticellae]|uniref:DUF6873 domain-containing protein n=1 Tax=Clostridium fermenticellae TaxID=2068654 RepID=A0A386H2K6_9CLOT|nr:hypothetical protein [Clostridium fermenticellae]AYD39773.1 hypothetical protein D4Z93_04275 [Clostridium fermenticellae]